MSRCPKFPEAIWHVLENTTSPEVCSTLFDMLKTCSEAPALVLHFSKGGLFEYMVTHMNRKLQTDAFRQLRVTSCDILVTLLSHDEAMQYAYDQDKQLYINTFLGTIWTTIVQGRGPEGSMNQAYYDCFNSDFCAY